MAAPSGTKWGSIAGGYGKLGLYVSLSSTNTETTVTIQIWFASKYSVLDGYNDLYFNNGATTATTLVKSDIDIDTTGGSGDDGAGWAAEDQVRLATYAYTYDRGTSASTKNCAAKFTGIDRVGATVSVSTSYTIPALASYKVSYNANGGSGAPSAQTKYYGKTLTLSSTKPTRSGYSFVGWGTSTSDTSSDYAAGASYTANAAITLYAIWKKTLTLTYNANGGSGAPASQSANIYNATTSYKFTLSSTKPTRTGYTFLGWSTSSTATSATYSAGGSITLSANDTLYAVWKINSYTLTINPNGGSWGGTTEKSTATQNYNTTKTIANPTWTGHTFAGWTLSGSGTLSGTTYKFGAGAATLTAKWDLNTYDITFNASNNGGTGNTVKTYNYGATLGTLPTASKKNYKFLGWYTAEVGGTKITSSYVVTKDATFFAQFEIDASAYVKDSTWEPGVAFVTASDGNTKKGRAKVKVNGVWKDGFCK